MFKEFLFGMIILAVLYVILRTAYINRGRKAVSVMLMIVLSVFCIANIIYNVKVMFPDYYMDTSTGVYRYGTFSGNLFAYSDEFRYRDEIIYPILRERHVLLDETGSPYTRFFSVFSADRSAGSISISPDKRRLIHKDISAFDYTTEFNMLDLMEYTRGDIPADLDDMMEEDIMPGLFINLESVKGDDTLVVMMDKGYDIYLMGKGYYEALE